MRALSVVLLLPTILACDRGGDPIARIEAGLTDGQRAALIAAARTLDAHKRPSKTVTPEQLVGLQQVSDALGCAKCQNHVNERPTTFLFMLDFFGLMSEDDELLHHNPEAARERARRTIADALKTAKLNDAFRAYDRWEREMAQTPHAP